ncbi:tetratricopeptide repeat protein [Vibrio marisflavi]|uniref:Photosystem I assembly protein Ycf3 n=1 Tax=Vibrio marisflavi CECT 7928 TaxID=634439 RepID=A0ABN8E6D2_9VIBR|nr:tetratricopeptide repeat protein [Vibrio marisflavi]CAH0541185.1 Photosystem I assembly protein Ycf3 [Vibrio marisflavi CECT 7928]
MKGFKTLVSLALIMLLSACASKKEEPKFDHSLYDGRSIDTLTTEEPAVNEQEAISRGDLALSNGNMDLALYEYINSLSYPEAVHQGKTLYNIGRIHQMRGNLALAEKAYLMSLEYDPKNVSALEQLGVLYSRSGDVEQGYTYFYRALDSDQERLKSTNRLKMGDIVTVKGVADLKVDKRSPSLAYMGLGVLTDLKGDHLLAQEFYTKSLEINPRSVKTLINIGYSYYMSGDYVKAQRFVVSALEKSPNNEKAQNNLALIYLAKGEVKRAINVFMRQMDAAEALNNVGYFLILQGKPEEAIPYLEQAIDKKPTYYKVANENLERALAEVRAKTVKASNSQ